MAHTHTRLAQAGWSRACFLFPLYARSHWSHWNHKTALGRGATLGVTWPIGRDGGVWGSPRASILNLQAMIQQANLPSLAGISGMASTGLGRTGNRLDQPYALQFRLDPDLAGFPPRVQPGGRRAFAQTLQWRWLFGVDFWLRAP